MKLPPQFYDSKPVFFLYRLLRAAKIPVDEMYFSQRNKLWAETIANVVQDSLENLTNRTAAWKSPAADYREVPIYFMWWQGCDEMPKIVELCYKSLSRYACNHPIVFINKNNIDAIAQKMGIADKVAQYKYWLQEKRVSVQHFSDLLRTKMLEVQGGIWVDSTVLLAHPIDEVILHNEFYSVRRSLRPDNNVCPSRNRWTSYFIYSQPTHPLVSFINNGLEECINKLGKIPTYFTMDFLFTIAYENNQQIRFKVDSIPEVPNTLNLINDMEKKLSRNEFWDLLNHAPLFKLGWRMPLPQEPKGTMFQMITDYLS